MLSLAGNFVSYTEEGISRGITVRITSNIWLQWTTLPAVSWNIFHIDGFLRWISACMPNYSFTIGRQLEVVLSVAVDT